jgi:hypothetical protein
MMAFAPQTIPWAGCVLHRVHLPKPVRTHLHHRFPKYLQMRKWGRVLDQQTVNVCASGHDDVHAAIEALLRGMPVPRGVGRKERELAEYAVRRYKVTP